MVIAASARWLVKTCRRTTVIARPNGGTPSWRMSTGEPAAGGGGKHGDEETSSVRWTTCVKPAAPAPEHARDTTSTSKCLVGYHAELGIRYGEKNLPNIRSREESHGYMSPRV